MVETNGLMEQIRIGHVLAWLSERATGKWNPDEWFSLADTGVQLDEALRAALQYHRRWYVFIRAAPHLSGVGVQLCCIGQEFAMKQRRPTERP